MATSTLRAPCGDPLLQQLFGTTDTPEIEDTRKDVTIATEFCDAVISPEVSSWSRAIQTMESISLGSGTLHCQEVYRVSVPFNGPLSASIPRRRRGQRICRVWCSNRAPVTGHEMNSRKWVTSGPRNASESSAS